jgi:hypothetical protein
MAILEPEFSTTDVMVRDFQLAREGPLGPSHNVVHGNFSAMRKSA